MGRSRTDDRAEPAAGRTASRDVMAPARSSRLTTDVREQQRRFGGLSLASTFFGWLSATGMATILVALLAAGGAALALTDQHPAATGRQNASTISLAAGLGLCLILFLAYLAGGYVAGRMARFDGITQGIGVWVMGVVITAALAAAGALFGSEYNVLSRFDLPNIPVDEGSLTTGGIVTLIAALIVTLIGAILGGKLGEAYHRRVDESGALAY